MVYCSVSPDIKAREMHSYTGEQSSQHSRCLYFSKAHAVEVKRILLELPNRSGIQVILRLNILRLLVPISGIEEKFGPLEITHTN